jgi:RNA polymerase-binding transcription factor DksA
VNLNYGLNLSKNQEKEAALMKPLTQSALEQEIGESNGRTKASARLVNAISNRLMKQRQRLLELREALLEEIHLLRSEASEENPNYSMHPADAATDSFDRDVVLGLASFKQEGLYEIDAALERIDDGTYGVCELTGQLIPWKRLEAIPWTRFSLEAEKQIERDTHPRIGPRGSVRQFEKPTDDRCLTICEERLPAEPFISVLHD